ncbi:MAG: TonB family protein [Pyrinomonadaceae bacterium]
MKKILIVLILYSACIIHAQTDDKETIKNLNQKVSSAYQKSDLDEALKYARQALDLSIKVFGIDSKDTAIIYTNLGIILRDKRKFKDSVVNLQNAIEIYRKESAKNNENVARVLEILMGVQYYSGDAGDAEKSAVESFKIREELYGKGSKELYLANLSMGEFYGRIKNKEKANEYYLNTYALALKIFEKDSSEFEKIADSRACSVMGLTSKDNEFEEAKRSLFGYETGDVVNGKAVKLIAPAYPAAARSAGAEGLVVIKVLINEQGNTTQANAICGHPLLYESSQEAALKSKFNPTLKNGVAVTVKGYIQYIYVRQ